ASPLRGARRIGSRAHVPLQRGLLCVSVSLWLSVVTATADVVVIGGGVNGLVTATLLAKAGLKTIVLEQSDRIGGCARTGEIAPGFTCPTLAHTAAIDPALLRTLGLERHGLRIIRPAADACAPTKDGRALVLWRDAAKAS